MTSATRIFLAVALAVGLAATPARSQSAETVLLNGKIVTLDPAIPAAEAMAIQDGRILGVGASGDMRKLACPQARVIDLGGRTVIPGLIDSHMHAIRAALFYATEVDWIDAQSIPEALARLQAAAKQAQPGQWLIVAGGWTEEQFAEKRRPTQAELLSVAPDNPVYIQLFYKAALLTPAAFKALNIAGEADLPGGGKLERDPSGKPTGWIEGGMSSITALFGKLPTPNFDQSVAGTKAFFRELSRLGLTGVSDPGGFNLAPPEYQPLFKVWQDKALTVRVRYSLFAQRRDRELEDFKDLTQMLPMGFGDDMLRFNGIGELVTVGMYNNDNPTDAQKEQLYAVAKWAAEHGMTLTHHWQNEKSAGQLLDVFERVNREVPIGRLRWSIAHLNDATPATFERMKALGIGWTMQDALYFEGKRFIAERGAAAVQHMPPVMTALRMGLHVGAGTDAHRVMSYNPFVALEWLVTGKTVGGTPTRSEDELPSREDALRLYTQGSAWFTFEEDARGTLAPGRAADLAVLDKDYLGVPADEIGSIQSLLTMVGGRVVYAAEPFASEEERAPK